MPETKGSHIIKPVRSEHCFDGTWQGDFHEEEGGVSETSREIVVVGTRGRALEAEREGSVQNRVQRKNWWSDVWIYSGEDGEIRNRDIEPG